MMSRSPATCNTLFRLLLAAALVSLHHRLPAATGWLILSRGSRGSFACPPLASRWKPSAARGPLPLCTAGPGPSSAEGGPGMDGASDGPVGVASSTPPPSSGPTSASPAGQPTRDDIDWAGLDPLGGMSYGEYEAYLETAPAGDVTWDETVPTLNQIYLVGRVGGRPEVRYVGPDRTAVVTMTLALPRYYGLQEREERQVAYGEEETEWHRLEAWGGVAEFALKFVEKGCRVGVIGSLDTDFFGKDDRLVRVPKILVQDLDILESRTESEARKVNQRGPSLFASDDDDDDDRDTYNPSSQGKNGGFFDPS